MTVEFFLPSAAPTAQNSQELHFRFINSFIQPSLAGSLSITEQKISLIRILVNSPKDSTLSCLGTQFPSNLCKSL